MCESNVYIIKNGNEELYAKDIVHLSIQGDKIVLVNIIGKRYELTKATIAYIDFLKHKIVLKSIQ